MKFLHSRASGVETPAAVPSLAFGDIPALGLMFLTCLLLTGCEPQGPKALLEGERVLKQERYNEAIALFQLATEKIPREARAWNMLGLAYQGAGLSSEAAQAYAKALALDHKLSAAHYNLGCLYLDQDQTQLAVTELTAFTLLQPRAVEGWLRLATAQSRVNRMDAAEICYRNALTLSPKHPEALNGMGVVSVNRRRYIEAIQYFQIALAEDPNYGPALLNQAIVTHRNLNQRVTALQKYRAYLGLQPRPENWEAVNQVAQSLADELSGSNRLGGTAGSSLTNTVYRTNASPTPIASASNPRPNASPTQTVAAAVPPGLTPPAPRTPSPTPAAAPAAAAINAVAKPAATPAPVVTTPTPVLIPIPPPQPATPKETVPPPPEVVVSDVGRDLTIKPAADPVLPPSPNPTRPVTSPAASTAQPKTSPSSGTTASTGPGAANRTAPSTTATTTDERPSFFQRLNPFRTRGKNEAALPTNVRADPPRSAAPPSQARELAATQAQATLADALPTEGFPRYTYRPAIRPAAGDRAKAAELVNKGIFAHRERKTEEELNFYRSATLVDPANYDAFFNLGLASAEQGDWGTALHAYEQALNIDPDSVNARYNFAAALRQSNFPIDAARELEAILQTRPEDGKTLLALGNLYAQKFKQNRTARYYYLRMLEAEPNHPKAPEVRFWLAANP